MSFSSLTIIGEVHQGNQSYQAQRGMYAENEILNLLHEVYQEKKGKVFLNQKIPSFCKVPDFIFPVIDKENNQISLIIIECKAATQIHRDGSTHLQDVYEQINNYVQIINNCFKFYQKSIDIKAYAIFPNAQNQNIPAPLKSIGRNHIKWGNLENLTNWLKNTEILPSSHAFYKKEMNYIYNRGKILKDEKINLNEKNQKTHIKDFGGIFGFKGLAGSGKTNLLADQMFKDASESTRELLYITHNKNLIKSFIKLIEKRSGKFSVQKKSPLGFKDVDAIELENGSIIYFSNFDSFPTRYLTTGLDNALFPKGENTLYSICKKHGIGDLSKNKYLSEEDFRNSRLEIISKLEQYKLDIRSNFVLFDAVYIDEFQDCKIDRSRLDIVLFFTSNNHENKPNLVFAEDPLQTFLKWEQVKELSKIQQEEDDETISITNKKRNDLLTYKSLFTFKIIPKYLNVIYRTPEQTFRASLSLIKDGFKKKSYNKLLDDLIFKNKKGTLQIISASKMAEEYNKILKFNSPSEIMIISHINEKNLFTPSVTHHHLESRGCEADVVFICLNNLFLDNPNYLYTLMCRTKNDLFLVYTTEAQLEKLNLLFEPFMNNYSRNPKAS